MQISLVPTYGLTSPEAIVVTSIFGTPMGRDCITAEEMDAPMEPPKPIMPSNLPSRSISACPQYSRLGDPTGGFVPVHGIEVGQASCL